MPVQAERKIAFCTKYLTNKEGRAYSVEGREWVRTEFFEPTDNWKLWPKDPQRLCTECKDRANTIVEWSFKLYQELEKHISDDCAGLALEPIMLTVLNIPRRGGKTFNVAAYSIATICLYHNKSFLLVASSGKQTRTLFHENYEIPITNNPQLKTHCKITGSLIEVPRTKSLFEIVETSHKSITGRGRTHVLIEEARDVNPRVAAALIPSMRDQNGLECPRGHMHIAYDERKIGSACNVCGDVLVPWYGRIIIFSSSGILEGDEKDWFHELVEQLDARPHPNAHLYRSDRIINPAVSEKSTKMIEDVFGGLESMRTYMDVELTNVARRKGEDFVSIGAIKAVTDASLGNSEGEPTPIIGFLDTSLSADVTSLVLVRQDEKCTYPWEHISVARIDTWHPKKLPGGVIDPQMIQAHLDRYLGLFPGLIDLFVDVRAMTWARDFVVYNQRERPKWGKKVKSYHGGTDERDIGWNQLEYRILHRKIRLPAHKELIEELKGVRRFKRLDGSDEIRDRSRRVRHADIAEALASCCERIYRLQTRREMTLQQANNAHGAEILNRLYRPKIKFLGDERPATDQF